MKLVFIYGPPGLAEEDFIAGGMLCGKSYQDIESNLKRLGYQKIL